MAEHKAKFEELVNTTKKTYTRFAVFSSEGTVVASSFSLSAEDVKGLLKSFESHDMAFVNGLDMDSQHYDVYRYYDENDPALVYGRTGGPDEGDGEGICIARFGTLWVAITYQIPMVAAKAIPAMIKSIKSIIAA